MQKGLLPLLGGGDVISGSRGAFAESVDCGALFYPACNGFIMTLHRCSGHFEGFLRGRSI